MPEPTLAPYGTWQSPIRAREIARGAIGLSDIIVHDDALYWNELRPSEDGRCVVVRREAGKAPCDLVPKGFSARTRVHEYGGGAYVPVGRDLCFVNMADQRVYRCRAGAEPVALTPDAPLRYADLVHDAQRNRLLCVREDHRAKGEPVNEIVAVDLADGGEGNVLVSGSDFYASPRLSPDGGRLAWLEWEHPFMPWDAASLWVARIASDNRPADARHIAGGQGASVVQPQWSPTGNLHFVWDPNGWWNHHRLRNGSVEPVLEMEADFGTPQWVFRTSTYAFTGPGRMVCGWVQNGLWHLGELDTESGELAEWNSPYTSVSFLRAAGDRLAFIGGSPESPTAVVLVNPDTGESEEVRCSSSVSVEPGCISAPQAVVFPTDGGALAHGLFYAPQNARFTGPPDERPPLLVMVHGGPTGAASCSMRPGIQYYTSRGFAVLDVNYRGSVGYGRSYREQLYGHWGVADVEDCCRGARYLAGQGRVDAERMAITGGSAGGYTVLACLTGHDVFAAGASHFGVSDCEALAQETHKFESRYLDRLIGPYPARRDLYVERSPIHHADRLSCPVIFFQGSDDPVVPPNQARTMVRALRDRGIPVAYLEFEGEQHGFRQAEHIERALEAELYFFARVFGFEPADEIEPVPIANIGE